MSNFSWRTGGRISSGTPSTSQFGWAAWSIPPRRPSSSRRSLALSWPLPIISQRHGVPATPDELVQHRIVGGTAAAVPTAWMFERRRKGVGDHRSNRTSRRTRTRAPSRRPWPASASLRRAAGHAAASWRMVRWSGCSRNGRWSASRCTPIFPWVQRLAPPGVRLSTISLLIFKTTRKPFRSDPVLNSRRYGKPKRFRAMRLVRPIDVSDT